MGYESKMTLKECAVLNCTNASVNTPSKLFVTVPYNEERRLKWLNAIGFTDMRRVYSHNLYVCEDHFDLSVDAENWMFFKMMGQRLSIKKGVVPHKNLLSDNNRNINSQLTDSAKKRKQQILDRIHELSEKKVKRELFGDEMCELALESRSENHEEKNVEIKTEEIQIEEIDLSKVVIKTENTLFLSESCEDTIKKKEVGEFEFIAIKAEVMD